MTRSITQALVSLGCTTAALMASSAALAQATPLPESIPIGGFTFRPSIELRLRGEYRQAPFDIGGVYFTRNSVLEDAYQSNLPPRFDDPTRGTALYLHQWAATSRARIGLAVDRGAVTGALVLQDTRLIAGAHTSGFAIPQNEFPSGFDVYEGYIDVHAKNRRAWFRIGRQRIVWGDGRLLGDSDWTQIPRSFDAVRLGFTIKRFDIEAFGAFIGASMVSAASGFENDGSGAPLQLPSMTGSQLFGLHLAWHAHPLLKPEFTALARIVRPLTSVDLTPSDTFVLSGRLSGDKRGFRYSAEGAYELGQVSSYGVLRDLRAYAVAARATWETALPWHMTFGGEGAYASGDNGSTDPSSVQTRFDPIVPDKRPSHNLMGLYSWSNLILAGGDITVRPADPLRINLGYRFVGLANPKGRWTSASLTTIGASPTNESRTLGHQIDVGIGLRLWEPLSIDAGYGLFLTGEGAQNILEASSRGPIAMQHFGYLQATLRAP